MGTTDMDNTAGTKLKIKGALALMASFLCSTAGGLAPSLAHAQGFPQKPITIVVTFGAGSASDVNARFYAKALKEKLNANALVDIRPGASGMIGAQVVAKAAPDGYTVLLGSGTVNAANYALFRDRIAYTPQQFDEIAIIYASPAVFFAGKDLPGDTVPALLQEARGRNVKLSCGSGNSVTEIACVMLSRKTGADLVSVPYKGNAQSLVDLAGGQISVAFSDAGAAMPFVSRGAIRPLGVPAAARLQAFPGVKTFAEQGIAGFEFLSWSALLVPAGTPREIVAALNSAARHMLDSPEWEKQRMNSAGMKLSGDLKEAKEFVAAEIRKWDRYVAESGVKGQ